MKTITVYDPPMCCSTGVCGPDVDPTLPRFAGMLSQLANCGVKVERYNLSQEPMAFAQNQNVRAELERGGTESLPMIYIDGKLEWKGQYPETAELAMLVERASEAIG